MDFEREIHFHRRLFVGRLDLNDKAAGSVLSPRLTTFIAAAFYHFINVDFFFKLADYVIELCEVCLKINNTLFMLRRAHFTILTLIATGFRYLFFGGFACLVLTNLGNVWLLMP